MIARWLFILASAAAYLPAADEIAMVDLATHRAQLLDKQEVEVVGFLHQLEDGSWALAAQPTLRSCCYKKQGTLLRLTQLPAGMAEDTIPAQQTPVRLQGTLSLADDGGQGDHLERAVLIPTVRDEDSDWLTGTALLVPPALIISIAALRQRRR